MNITEQCKAKTSTSGVETKVKASFPAFFLQWARLMGWKVPPIHIAICHFLENRGRDAVLRVFRGCGKSTILAIYNAWRYYQDPTYRILHQGDQDDTALKTARDTMDVIIRHPLTRHMAAGIRGGASQFWVPGYNDPRNASMRALGIIGNITGSRADEIQNDDVEVLKNIKTPQAREKIRHHLSEQIHVGVPGSKRLFVGTPHTHNSLYDERIQRGAEHLTIPLFLHEQRLEDKTDKLTSYSLTFYPEFVFSGIGKETRILNEGEHWVYEQGRIVFKRPPNATVDCYRGNAWPERFTTEEMLVRRKECDTFNYWDSQYQLHAKPINQVRLDPEKMPVYACEPMIGLSNKNVVMWLGNVQIAGMACTWDPSAGKPHSDKSVLNVTLQDTYGTRYWHVSKRLRGEIADFADNGKDIVGGQVHQICEAIKQYNIPRVCILTTGLGQFAPQYLKACIKQKHLRCGVTEMTESWNKNREILGQIQGPLDSGKLWVNLNVIDDVEDQMKEWNPAVAQQPDDDLDALAKSIKQEPERIKMLSNSISKEDEQQTRHDWRQDGGTHDVLTDY